MGLAQLELGLGGGGGARSPGEGEPGDGGRGRGSRRGGGEEEAARRRRPGGSASAGSGGGRREDQDQEEDVNLAEVLAYLLRRGQVRLVHGGGATGLQLVQAYSDSDEDSDSAWDGCLGDRYHPPVDMTPDTREIDASEIKTQIQLATGTLVTSPTRNVTRLLRQREHGLCCNGSFSHGECSRVTSQYLPNHMSHIDSFTQKAFCWYLL
ncbi:DDB1- and CUL4-associated factor 11 [Heptranchias perlo]|uniref:DDB1- and CUL4-associated factor 11 n=1 Tax=Heptranchias perlo TaxID=212740 RepID=UPI00355AB69D